MSRVHRVVGAVSLLLVAGSAAAQSSVEVVTELRIHGNYSVPDADVLRLVGVVPGDRIGPDTIDAIVARLRDSD